MPWRTPSNRLALLTDSNNNPDDALADGVGPEDYQLACPYLGLERDSATHARQPTPLHRCFRSNDNVFAPVELHQIRFCLSQNHTTCRTFVEPGWRAEARRSHSTNSVGERTAPVRAGERRETALSRKSALIAVLLLAFALAMGITVARVLGTFGTAADSAAPEGNQTALVLPTRTSTEEPTPATVASPTPSVAPSPTRPPTYVVKAGDSYTRIAQDFGITVDQLLVANRRTLATQLFPGEVLTIP